MLSSGFFFLFFVCVKRIISLKFVNSPRNKNDWVIGSRNLVYSVKLLRLLPFQAWPNTLDLIKSRTKKTRDVIYIHFYSQAKYITFDIAL